MPIKSTGHQHGVALVTILLLLALLTAIVSRLALSSSVWLKQVDNIASLAEAVQANRAAQFWVARLLEEDGNNYDGLTDSWAQTIPPVPFNGGVASGWVEDMQARFNVNNLVNTDGQVDNDQKKYFTRLLDVLDLDPAIADAMVDWLDRDDRLSGPWGAEDAYYMTQTPPYVPANREMIEVAEMRLVRGINTDVYRRLAPHVCALPVKTAVNLNTASAPVLAAIVTVWGPAKQAVGQAKRWLQKAATQPARKLEDFVTAALNDEDTKPPAGLTVASHYFLAHIQITVDDFNYRSAALYQRNGDYNGLIWHSRELL